MCQCSARTCRGVRSTETHARSTREASYSSFRLSETRKDNYANFHPVEMERLKTERAGGASDAVCLGAGLAHSKCAQ